MWWNWNNFQWNYLNAIQIIWFLRNKVSSDGNGHTSCVQFKICIKKVGKKKLCSWNDKVWWTTIQKSKKEVNPKRESIMFVFGTKKKHSLPKWNVLAVWLKFSCVVFNAMIQIFKGRRITFRVIIGCPAE